MAPSIPDRWIPYKACGNVIEGTRIACFKVPLRKTVQQGHKEITEIWDIKTLLKTLPKLSAVIDLTNTARYYNPKELQDVGVLHKKIYMPGRIIPPEDKVVEFMDAVDEFLGNDCVAVQVRRARVGSSTTESLVGVHCTHGLNRTGYMVCRYMRDRLGVDAKEAIKKFEIARGYKIERENYIANLIGEKPPPPFEGNHTELKPVDERDVDDARKSADDSDYYRKNAGRKYCYNGENWRDERGRDSDSGRYVRHPNYDRKRSRDDQGTSRNYNHDQNSRYTSNRRSSVYSNSSDRSYDFKHDY